VLNVTEKNINLMTSKKSQIFDAFIGLIPFIILIYFDPKIIFHFFALLISFIIYLSLKPKIKFLWNKYILKDLDESKKKHLKISELTTSKTVTRRAKNGGYETIDFTMKYNPDVENFNLRLVAKILDIAFYYFLIYLTTKYFKISDINILFMSFLATILISPILETITGRTFGKFITGLQVVDDNCEYPYILKSYARNILPYFDAILWMILYLSPFEDIYFHNEKTKTYTIYSKDKKKIIEMMRKK